MRNTLAHLKYKGRNKERWKTDLLQQNFKQGCLGFEMKNKPLKLHVGFQLIFLIVNLMLKFAINTKTKDSIVSVA